MGKRVRLLLNTQCVSCLCVFSVLAFVSAGCNDGTPRFLGQSGQDCIDASGENSNPHEIVDVLLNQQVDDGASGHRSMESALDEHYGDSASVAGQVLREANKTVRGTLHDGIASAQSLLPVGGDARFARAVCDYVDEWDPAWSGGAEAEELRRTPHLIRAVGRSICAAAPNVTVSAESYFEELDDEALLARQDPEGYKNRRVGEVEEALATLDAMAEGWDFAELARIELREGLETLHKLPAEEVATLPIIQAELTWKAVEFQCPAWSEKSFGDK